MDTVKLWLMEVMLKHLQELMTDAATYGWERIYMCLPHGLAPAVGEGQDGKLPNARWNFTELSSGMACEVVPVLSHLLLTSRKQVSPGQGWDQILCLVQSREVFSPVRAPRRPPQLHLFPNYTQDGVLSPGKSLREKDLQ